MSDPKYINVGEPEDKVIEELCELLLELSEVSLGLIKEICKARRFGYFNYHPSEPDKLNWDRVKAEMDDCVQSFEKLEVKMRKLVYEHYNKRNAEKGGNQCA